MSRFRSPAVGAIALEVGPGNLVLRNQAGTCLLGLRTGRLEFRPAEAGRGATLTAEPFALTGSHRHSAAGESTARWNRSGAGRNGGPIVLTFSRPVGDRDGRLHWRISAVERHFVVQIGFSGGGESLVLLGANCGGDFLVNARQPRVLKIAYCGAHSQSELSRSEVQAVSRTTRVRSWWTTALFDAADQSGYVLGFLSALRFTGSFEVTGFSVEASNATEAMHTSARRITWSEPLWIAPTRCVTNGLLEYGKGVGKMGGRRSGPTSICGWGSWGYLADDITARTVLTNAAVLRRTDMAGGNSPLVQVDHGWEEQIMSHRPKAVWEARAEFGRDMETLGRELRAIGCRFGLWVVPFAINAEGPLSRKLRAAVVCDDVGEPKPVVGSNCYCVDPTSPGGEAWLRALFRRLRRWGVTYYKLDFLRVLIAHEPDDADDGVGKPRRFHTGVTRVEAYRRGLTIIRETVGPRAHLLACGAPLLPGAGLVDSCRVGSDIKPEWEVGRTGIKSCAENVRCNFFWHRQVWANDPDLLVLPRDRRLFRTWITAVAFSGGPALISAELSTLSATRRRVLRRFLPPVIGMPVPLGLAPKVDGVRIALPLSAHGEQYHLVAFFNRGPRRGTFSLDAAEIGVAAESACVAWDVVGSRPHGKVGRNWNVEIAARDARILCVRKVLPWPQLVGTSGHFSMGEHEIAALSWHEDSGALQCSRCDGRAWPDRLYFHVPKNLRPTGGRKIAMASNSRIAMIDLRGFHARTLSLSFLPHQ